MAGYIGSKVAVVSSGAERKKVITATAGQTSFTGLTYSPNRVHVFQNGVRLVDGTDYTATDGTSLTLTVGASVNDQVVVVSYSGFQTSDTVSSSAGGTFTGDVNFTGAFTSQGIDDNATSTAMTLDGSGNLLVGTTNADPIIANADGVSIGTDKIYRATVTGGPPIALSRKGNDGSILACYRDTTFVGSIGAYSGSAYVGSGDTALYFGPASDAIMPFETASLTGRDNAIDLGVSGARFKDLYLSGGVFLGGTGSSNKLDDYEIGTWTPSDLSGAGLTLGITSSSYTKIGRLCYIYAYIQYPSTASGSTQTLGGLPFTAKAGATYAQLTVRVTSNTLSAANLTFQVTTSSTHGIIHDGLSSIVNADLSSKSILISGCYEVA